jgi:FSR family fosmidomycin resistance protein-like MFS transporter
VLADVRGRRALVVWGGVAFAGSLGLMAVSPVFGVLALATFGFGPAAGAFVSVSQLALVDSDPASGERNMARWALVGSVANVAGPICLAGATAAGFGWRGLYAVYAALSIATVALLWRAPLGRGAAEATGIAEGIRAAASALCRLEVVRWIVLLECANLMLDVLHGYLALYFVDVVGAGPWAAGLAIPIWTGVGLAGDALLVVLLGRMNGIRYLRASAAVVLVVFPAFLLAPNIAAKLVLLALIGLLNAGWYAILQARLYASLPGQSGAALAGTNIAGLVAGLVPLAIGAIAGHVGLGPTMWLLLAGPVALLVALPRRPLPDEADEV